MSALHHWLLLPVSADSAAPVSAEDPLLTALEPLHLPLDSDVTVARPVGDHIVVQEVYRLVTGRSLTETSPRDWSPAEGFPVSPERDNYRGIVLPSATVVSVTERKWMFGLLVSRTASSCTWTVRPVAVCLV